MQIKKVTLATLGLNVVLGMMVVYIVGVEVGKNTTDVQVDQVAINYAVYQALKD
jgi:hypothetical protein